MAPERFLGRPADARTDLFAAGVILFQLLTGAKPFVADDLPELMQKLLNELPPSIMTLRPTMWAEMDAVAQKALARNPEDRFQSAENFVDALNAAMEARTNDNLLPVDLTKLSRTAVTEAAASPAPAKLSVTMAEQLSVGAIDGLSRTLARWLGPIARFVVNQALQETSDADALLASLSRQIKTDAEIALFRRAAEKLLREDFHMASACARAREKISDAEIKAAIDALICEIGPIARRLVSMEAQTAVGRDDFYRRLADQLPDERAKARFLALRERPAGERMH